MSHTTSQVAVVALFVLVAIFLTSQPATASIISINATYLNTTFAPSGGAHSIGLFTISDVADIIKESDTGVQDTFDNGSLLLAVSLLSDTSAGGQASGLFDLGSFTIKDSSNLVLLTGTVDSLTMAEVPGVPDLLAAQGAFTITGGSLQPDYGTAGDVVTLTFRVNPSGITGFGSGFTAKSDVTLNPVPEPATLMLLGTGVLALRGFARRRRA